MLSLWYSFTESCQFLFIIWFIWISYFGTQSWQRIVNSICHSACRGRMALGVFLLLSLYRKESFNLDHEDIFSHSYNSRSLFLSGERRETRFWECRRGLSGKSWEYYISRVLVFCIRYRCLTWVMAPLVILCHKEPAQGTQGPLIGKFLVFLWFFMAK